MSESEIESWAEQVGLQDMTDAQASIVTQGLPQEQTEAALDMLKFYFAVADQVNAWRVTGQGDWRWSPKNQRLGLTRGEGTKEFAAEVVNYPPGFGRVST